LSKLRVTWTRSAIDYEADQKATIKALGLKRLHQTVVKDDNPSMRGMLFKVKHMVRVEEVADGQAA